MKSRFYLFLHLILTILVINIQPAFSEGSSEKELFVVAQRAFEDGFYDVSLRYVDQLIKEFPQTKKYVETRLLEGQCYFFKKQYLKAFNVFQELTRHTEYKDVTLFWLGETYLKVGDHAKAQNQYKELIQIYPTSLYAAQGYYSLGWSLFEKGDYESARNNFVKLVELYPSNNLAEDAAFKAGECAYNAGQYEGAVFQFQKFIQTHPNSRKVFDANFNIAEAFYYLDQYDKASGAYRKALEGVRDSKEKLSVLVGLGWSFFKANKFDEAIKAFDEAQAHAKASNIAEDEILLGKASLFSAQDKQNDALMNYSDLIDRFPQSLRIAEGYLGRANTYYLLNDYPNAINDYKKILDLSSSQAKGSEILEKARFGLAWTYLKNGSLDQSIESFKGVLEKTQSKTVKVSAMTQIGDAYQEAGQVDNAIETYDKILKEMPDTPYSDYVQHRLGVALLKAGRIDTAILAFQSLQANYPKSKFIIESKYYLGAAYFKKHDWAGTIQVLEPFVAENPRDNEFSAEASYLIALAFFNQKQYDEALEIFNELLKLYPDKETLSQNVQLGIAKTKYEMGNFKDALAIFKEIDFRFPGTDVALESLMWMGQHNMVSGIYERASENYLKAITDFPKSDKRDLLHFELGRAYHAQSKFDKALEQYRQVKGEFSAKAKLAIAEIFSQELDPEKAIEIYQSIIATSPEFKRDALVKIGQVYRKLNKHVEEIKAYEEALLEPLGVCQVINAEIQFLIGDTYELMNEVDKAVEVYFKIPYVYVKEQVWVVKAYLRIARIYENKEDWEKALAAYGKVVELKVDESKFAEERMSRINSARNLK
ncbi:MAG: tetratricopeptide repeat protein [Candidatus Omnitrophica bacterium]|nr:tetratricopeptide repeat protein [Candidatus Omnitrophota bacterium]